MVRVSKVLIGLYLTLLPQHALAQSVDDMLRSIFEASKNVERVANKHVRELEYLWLVIASRDSSQEAIQVANGFAPVLGDVSVVQASNGRFAVVAGFLGTAKAKANTQALKAIRLIPEDSFLSAGDRFRQIIWSSGSEFESVEVVQRPVLRQTVSRLQRALLQLGLYSGAVDGSIGPSTSGAFQSFVQRFAPQVWETLDEYALASIEQISVDGFRTEQERREARDKGFQDAESVSQATSAGFSTQSEFLEASRSGFSNKFDYDQFRASGFQTKPEFEEAKRQGFTSKTAYDENQQKLQNELVIRATELLEDAEKFLRINPKTTNIVEIASTAAALKAALGARKTEEILRQFDGLNRYLLEVSGFEAFAKARSDERAAEKREKITRLRDELERQRTAIRLWMAQNLMHQATADLADEMVIVGKAVDSGDLDTLAASVQSLSELLTRWGLKADIDELVSSGGMAQTVREAPEYTITQTPLNAFLLNGNGDERIALYNASASAPSIIRNLVGDFVFEKRTAKICLVPASSDPALSRAIGEELSHLDAERIDISRNRCTADNLLSYDIILLTRRDFLKSETGFALRVLQLLETRDLREFAALSHTALEKRQAAEKVARESISRDIEAGLRNGFGALVITDGGSRLCAVVSEAALEHQKPLEQIKGFIRGETRKPLDTDFTDAEGAYRSTQRKECMAVYASAPDLKLISSALTRDGRIYAFVPLWYDMSTISEIRDQKLQEEAHRQAELDAKKLAVHENRKIEEEKEKRSRAEAVERERGLQAKHGALARAIQSRLADGLKKIVFPPSTDENDDRVDQLVSQANFLFPHFTGWNSGLKNDLWTAKDINTEIIDYGSGAWNTRQLEQIALRVEVGVESAERGEKHTECFQLGVLVDDEFKSYRDGLDVGCKESDSELVMRWKAVHNFESRWRAE